MKRLHVSLHIVLFCLLLAFFPVNAQLYKFYDARDGLSSSLLNAIVQDNEGYIWIATEDGLNRFDGNRFVVYRNIPGDTTSLPNNYIRNIMEDSKQRLWVTTMAGLCRYDRETDRFIPYPLLTYDKSRTIGQCFYLMEDREGHIWVSASGNGVVRMDVENDKYQYFNVRNSAICSDHINVIYEDRFGNVWFGSGQQGLSIYNPSNGTFRTFRYHPENENGITSNSIASICEDTEGNVWIGTLTGGVNIYSFATQTFRKFNVASLQQANEIGYLLMDKEQNVWIGKMGSGVEIYSTTQKKKIDKKISTPQVDLSRSKVQTMYEDRQGNIWMGLFEKGLFMIPREKGFFTNYSFNPYNPENSIGAGATQPIFSDSGSDIWIGVGGTSIYRFDKEMHIKKIYRPGQHYPLLSNIVLSFYEDKERNLWLGTYLNGVIRYNRAKDNFDMNLVKGDPPYGLLSTHVSDIAEDADGKMWIITNGGGINIYDRQTGKFRYHYRNDADSNENQLIDNWCNQLVIDRDSLFWIATYRGVSTYERATDRFTHYTTANGKLPNDVAFCLRQDSQGNMWVGTADGLVRIAPDKQTVRMFGLSEGLPNSLIHGIDEDKNGHLWISTNYGLSMYNPQTDTFTNYTAADGLSTNELNRNAFFKTPGDLFLIGSTEGVTTFNPSAGRHDVGQVGNLVFTNLYIFNEPVRVGSEYGNVLHKTMNYSDRLTFTHQQNSFSVEFAALEYVYPQKVQYEVMMKGFDNDWRPAKNRMVTYTNLNPGDYTLQVKAWINEKQNAVTKELKVTILPPLWATTRAKILYVLLILILSYFIFRAARERMNTKRQEQLMQAKLQFFTDISHEIRTPLTLILSPLSKLISQNKDVALMPVYNSMYKNGIRLLQLVNQVMDLRALEFGKKKLLVEKTSITSFIRELKNSFNNLAEEKNLSYEFTSVPEEITGYIDRDTMAKVLFNLISNAFKYTETGSVAITLTINEKQKLVISIADTGVGITKENQALIFERFYTVTKGHDRVNSSGIGLHLTRKLVELHHGAITLQSQENQGSTFTVTLPFRKEDFAAREISEAKEPSSLPSFRSFIGSDAGVAAKKAPTASSPTKPKLLIVEDNREIRNLLLSEFESTFRIFEAENGQEGLRIAMENEPDIIFCDVVMPVMDGIEFCQKIRHVDRLAQVPLIMLTARTTIEQQIEGLEHGADAYIPKPFDLNYLRAQAMRLLRSRRNLKKGQPPVSEEEKNEKPPVETTDKKLFRKLDELIAAQIDNPDLSVDFLCKELALSRTHLNRKVKELTGDSPASYIRQRRLQQSVRLLKEKQLTVSEIAFAVGFSSPSYFSQAFRDYYGVTPKEYILLEEK